MNGKFLQEAKELEKLWSKLGYDSGLDFTKSVRLKNEMIDTKELLTPMARIGQKLMNPIKIEDMKIDKYKRLNEINLEIDKLNAEKKNILIAKNEEFIRSLEWTKECDANFEVYGGQDTFNFYIKVNGNCPLANVPIAVSEGIDYVNYSSKGIFRTTSIQALFKFLSEVKFKTFDYNKKLFNLLEQLKTLYGEN